MANSKIVSFFCDECGVTLSTGNVCPQCKRVLCHKHHFGPAQGWRRRRDGLCVACAASTAKANTARPERGGS